MKNGKDPEASMDDMQNEFRSSKKKAEKIVNDRNKVEEVLEESIKMGKRFKEGPLSQIWEDLQLLFSLLKDWISKEYTDIPMGSVIAIIGGLLYLISPIDLIPDFIPVIGLIDDVFILGLVLNQVHADLQKYKEWKGQ